jgi:hypothetical protein
MYLFDVYWSSTAPTHWQMTSVLEYMGWDRNFKNRASFPTKPGCEVKFISSISSITNLHKLWFEFLRRYFRQTRWAVKSKVSDLLRPKSRTRLSYRLLPRGRRWSLHISRGLQHFVGVLYTTLCLFWTRPWARLAHHPFDPCRMLQPSQITHHHPTNYIHPTPMYPLWLPPEG